MRAAIAALILVPGLSFAQVSTVGDIVVVQDPTGAITDLVAGMNNSTIIPSPQEQFCRAAYNQLRTVLPDEYDGIFSFTTSEALTDISNVWQGNPVRADGSGYGRDDSPWKNTYNGQKIGQCVFMGTLGHTQGLFPGSAGTEALPANPQDPWSPSLGIPIPGIKSLKGIEMLGHEYGHHWLLGIDFDQGAGKGKQNFIRGYDSSGDPNTTGGSPNQHYSAYADSRSVMYGDCITDLGGGSFKFEGCVRKYSHIDQYLMGLRAPGDVTPMMVLEDAADLGHGSPAIAMGIGSSRTATGYIRHDISAQDVIAAMGSRTPGYPTAKSCFRVAFVVVLAPGQTSVPTAMLQKVQAYQAAWSPWFSFATDGRGTMDARVNGTGCQSNNTGTGGGAGGAGGAGGSGGAGGGDQSTGGGAGGSGGGDPGTGGGGEAGTGGGDPVNPDPGTPPPSKDDTHVDLGTTKLKPGCGCTALSSFEPMLALFALAGLRLRRRR